MFALADEDEGRLAVHVHGALGERPPVAGRALLDLDLNSADGVGHPLEALEVDHGDVVDLDAEQVLHRLDEQRSAAERIGSVELVLAAVGDRHVEVAREVDERDVVPVLRNVDEDHDVRSDAAPVSRPVAADEQVVRPVAGRLHDRLAGVVRRPGHVREQLLLLDVRRHDLVQPDEVATDSQNGHEEQDERRDEDPPVALLLPLLLVQVVTTRPALEEIVVGVVRAVMITVIGRGGGAVVGHEATV